MALQRRKPAAIGVEAPYPRFIEPALLAEIEYRAQSAEGKVRHHFSKASGRIYDP
jgi:hypothetical protein